MKQNVLYHGSPNIFSNFSLDISERNTKNETNSLGIWLSNNIDLAKNFAIKYFLKYEESKTDFWENGSPKVFGKNTYEIGGIYEVDIKDIVLKEYVLDEFLIAAYETTKAKLEKDIKELKIEIKSLRNKIFGEYTKSDLTQYNKLSQKCNKLETYLNHFRYSHMNDSFDVFMNDRDQFCKYIAGKKGVVSWKERYILENKEEANIDFVNYLKNQGYDGFIIKDTAYDTNSDDERQDQVCIFNLDKINIFNFTKLENVSTQEELSTMKESVAKNSFALF